MKLFLISSSVLLLSSMTLALPTRLTEEQFLSSVADAAEAKVVDIVSGYAQVRRQGRNFDGNVDKSFNRPVTVKDPRSFNPPTEARRIATQPFDDEKAPVFDLEKMIKNEAEKLKVEVEVASLMAAHAASEAAARITSAAEEAVESGKMAAEQVDKIIEEAVANGLHEAEDIVKAENVDQKEGEESTEKVATDKAEDSTQKPSNVEWASEDEPSGLTENPEVAAVGEKVNAEESESAAAATTTPASNNSSEEKNDISEESDETLRAQTTEPAHPPQDVDLGSVQEV